MPPDEWDAFSVAISAAGEIRALKEEVQLLRRAVEAMLAVMEGQPPLNAALARWRREHLEGHADTV